VLVIVRDRVKAEGGASKELRVLARALRCADEAETCVEIVATTPSSKRRVDGVEVNAAIQQNAP